MKKCILIIAICLQVVICFAQAPGYLGKKINVSYEIEGKTYGLSSLDYGFYKIPSIADYELINAEPTNYFLRHNIKVDYVISRRTTIGLRIARQAIGLRMPEMFGNEVIGYKATTNEVGLIGNFYPFKSKGLIAPLGTYTSFEIFYANPVFHLPSSVDYTFYTGGLALGLGNRFIIGDIISLSPELRFAITIAEEYPSYVRSILDYGRLDHAKYNVYTQLLTLKIGLGILL